MPLKPLTVVDIGTGSGCIAVTLARERPDLRIIATDCSADALEVAQDNARLHGVSDRVIFRQGEGLEPVHDLTEPFLAVSNPPYVPVCAPLPAEVRDFEPAQALFAGGEGMDVLHTLFRQSRKHPFCCGVIVECGEKQVDPLLKESGN